MTDAVQTIKDIVDQAHDIVIIQADNPDGDSLGSALALEQILHKLGKSPSLYCGVTVPSYLRYLPGWDRVEDALPKTFDASIIVDASTMTLLEKIQKDEHYQSVVKKPCIVIDHHASVEQEIPFAEVLINEHDKSSAGEVLYGIAKELDWEVSAPAAEAMMTAILGDTQGLSNELTNPDTYRVVAQLVESGADRPDLERRRREFSKMPEVIYKFKADLIHRTQFYLDNRLALVVVNQNEIETYSPLYNPGPLVQNDMLQVDDVAIAIVLKRYDSGKTTAAIRSNTGSSIAGELAIHFGGGGHAFAAGFKLESAITIEELTNQIKTKTEELLANG